MAAVPQAVPFGGEEDGPYTAELRKISSSTLTVLIVDETDGPMATKHDFQAAMARAQGEHIAATARVQREHEDAMAEAAREHEQQISLIHQTYGVIYDNKQRNST